MRHILAVIAVLLPLLSPAATISSTTCASPNTTGCVTISFTNYPGTVSAVGTQVTGTWVGTIEFQGSVDGTTFTPLRGYPVGGGVYASDTSSNGAWTVLTASMLYFRVRATAWTSGSATVSLHVTSSPFMPDVIRAVGATFGEVQVSGTVTSNPSQAFLDALAPACTYPAGPPVVAMSITPVTMDDPTITNRSEMTIVNEGTTNNVWCCRGAACTPTATARYIIFPKVALTFEGLRDSDVIRCRSSAGSPDASVVEVSCGQ